MAIITQRNGTLEYLAAEHIPVPHGFTTRLGGVSQGACQGLNISFHRGDAPEAVEENLRLLSQAVGFSPERLVLTRQTHSDIVRTVTRADAQGLDHHTYPECDALITNDPGTALMVFTADCTPILFFDPVTGAVGAAHAGWRGTAADIAGKTVRAMCREFGCQPQNIRSAIGPNLGPCCFQTDADVPQAMVATFGQSVEAWIQPRENKFYVNLKAINAYALRRAGVEQIAISEECTMCAPHRYWSHRYTGGDRGSQGAVILCKEVRQ